MILVEQHQVIDNMKILGHIVIGIALFWLACLFPPLFLIYIIAGIRYAFWRKKYWYKL